MTLVRETCPAPACNLALSEIEALPVQLTAYVARLASAFARAKL